MLQYAHGSKLSGHYAVQRTRERVAKRFWWKGWQRDVQSRVNECVACAGVKATKPGRNDRMQVYHPSRRFSQVAVDIQTVTPRTSRGNIKILVIVDTFTRFARAVAVPNEKAETIAKALIDEWISIFGAMETLLSDRGPNFIGEVVTEMAARLGVRRVTTTAFRPQTNGCAERFNRTLAQDIACFVSTGQDDWDHHVALACFRYNSGITKATGMSPYEAMFGIEPFMAWGHAELKRVAGEPYDLRLHLRKLHESLVSRGKASRSRAALQYDATVKGVVFKKGDRVLVWCPDLTGQDGSKLAPPWMGPYFVDKLLSHTSYLLRSEHGNREARVHANRLRKISKTSVETAYPRDGVFPDGLRMIRKIGGMKCEKDSDGKIHRFFRVQMGGRKSPRWTSEHDLPEAVVAAWTTLMKERDGRI